MRTITLKLVFQIPLINTKKSHKKQLIKCSWHCNNKVLLYCKVTRVTASKSADGAYAPTTIQIQASDVAGQLNFLAQDK